MNAFFDSNIVLYLISADRLKANRSSSLINSGGVVSVQVLNEVSSAARRKHGLSWEETRALLDLARARCETVPLTLSTHLRGLEIAERYRLNVYDGMILAAAEQAGCGTVYSEDMHDGLTLGALRIVNPYRAST